MKHVILALLSGALLCAAPALPDPALQPAAIVGSPGSEYAKSQRGAQGVPAIERASQGRLWASWYTTKSPRGVESPGSYIALVTSGDDGRTWSDLKLVVRPPRLCRVYDPCLWLDPDGRMWFFWAQSAGMQDGRMGVWAMTTANPDAESPAWSEPRRIGNGVMLNKPTLLKSGDWLLPAGLWRDAPSLPNVTLSEAEMAPYTRAMLIHDLGDERGSNLLRSRDRGKTFEWIGQARVPGTTVDEHMIVERRDGRLWMLVRTTSGIGQSFSSDGGRTWSPGEPYLGRGVAVFNARFFIRRMQSGALLMVRHDGRVTSTRSHLAAFVSDDEGSTWKGGLMIDERPRVTYPDCTQAPDGRIYMIYDFERGTLARDGHKGVGAIMMAVFREEDARAGRAVSKDVRLRTVVNQLR